EPATDEPGGDDSGGVDVLGILQIYRHALRLPADVAWRAEEETSGMKERADGAVEGLRRREQWREGERPGQRRRGRLLVPGRPPPHGGERRAGWGSPRGRAAGTRAGRAPAGSRAGEERRERGGRRRRA